MRGSAAPLRLRREALLSPAQLRTIEETAIRILETLGLAVHHEEAAARLRAAGFVEEGGRFRIGAQQVEAFLERERAANGHAFGPAPPPGDDTRLTMGVNPYSQWVHDLEADRLVPFSRERLVEATKLVDVLSSRGLAGPAPGCPMDVPAALQPVVQYQIGATYSRHGRHPVDPKARVTLPYVMEMAEVLGHPLRGLPVYVFSPLTLAGESLAAAIEFRDRLTGVWVGTMASLGCTTPVNPGDAFAQQAAEAVGAAILLEAILDFPVGWHVRLCPFDHRALAMVLGSPEDLLLQMMNEEVNAYLHGTPWSGALSGLHTNAKLPGAQACTEKASLMTTGALLGARWMGAAGSLGFDEVFSAEQLLYDLEIKDHVERMVRGMKAECDPERCLADLEAGVGCGSFVALDSTLDAYREVYWLPELFERDFLAAWRAGGERTIRQKGRELVARLVAQHDYELPDDERRALDAVVARAWQELG